MLNKYMPAELERTRRLITTARKKAVQNGLNLSTNAVELGRRGDEEGLRTTTDKARAAFTLAQKASAFLDAISDYSVTGLNGTVLLLRPLREKQPKPPKEPRERGIRDIGQTQLTVGKAYFDINKAGTDFAYPRPTDVASKIDISSPNTQKARNGVIRGLRRIDGIAEEKIPARLKDLFDHARAMPQYADYSIDDLILIIQRKKDFEGRVKPEKAARSGRVPREKKEARDKNDLTDAEEAVIYDLFKVNRWNFEHPTITELGRAYGERLGKESVPSRLQASVSKVREAIIRKFITMWGTDSPPPARIGKFIAWLETIPVYETLTNEQFIDVARRDMTFGELLGIPRPSSLRKVDLASLRAREIAERGRRVEPTRKSKERKEAPLRDISEREDELLQVLLMLNERGEWVHTRLQGAASSLGVYAERAQTMKGDERIRLFKAIGVAGSQISDSILMKFDALWRRKDTEVPSRMAAAIVWLSEQPAYWGLTRQGFRASVKRKVRSLEEALAIEGRVFIKKGRPARAGTRTTATRERGGNKFFTAHQESAVRLLFAFNPAGSDYAELGAITVGMKVWGPKHGLRGSPSLATFQAVDRFVGEIKKVDSENPDYSILPGQVRRIVDDVLAQPGCEALKRDDLVEIVNRKIDFEEVMRRGRGIRPETQQRNARHGVVFQTTPVAPRGDKYAQASQLALSGNANGAFQRHEGTTQIFKRENNQEPFPKVTPITIKQAANLARLLSAAPQMLAPYNLDSFPQEMVDRLMKAASDGAPFQFEPHTLSAAAIQLYEMVLSTKDDPAAFRRARENSPELGEFLDYALANKAKMRFILNFATDVEDAFARRQQQARVGS